MRIGIIGLPQTGKKTLFSLLVGPAALAGQADARAAARGMADVRDARFDRLVDLYRPKRQVRARLEVVLCPSVEANSLSEGEALKEIAEVDALCHVVRVFPDESVYHIWSEPDPRREVEFLHGEMVLHDLVFIEKRLERIDKNLKKGKDDRTEKERALLVRFRAALEKGKVDYQLISYGGAQHSFTVPDADAKKVTGLKYDAAADRRSWEHMKQLFNEVFAAK